jgi:hypothetical protein
MKHCSLQLLGLGLIGGSIMSAMPTTGKDAFERRLTEDQYSIWSEIRKERFSIYLFSLSVALLVARTIPDKLYRTIVALSLTASLYMIVPKSKYMVDHLRSEAQTKGLRELYQNQIWKYHGTIVLALLGIPFICK